MDHLASAVFVCTGLLGPFLGASVLAQHLAGAPRFAAHAVWFIPLSRGLLRSGATLAFIVAALLMGRGETSVWTWVAAAMALPSAVWAVLALRTFRREWARVPV